jgi:transcription termination/antitermination protein NusA
VDPVGACVGPRGSRVRMVVSELRGEKIDIIPFNEEPARFVAKALSPARVREVLVDDEAKQATVIVPDDQLSLAIGKDGLNARLAARLTGWRVDIRSETEFAEEEAEMGYAEEEVAGRCAAILANGKRCPNASLPGSRYCGLPAHQALADQDTDYVVPPEEGEEPGQEPVPDDDAPTGEELAEDADALEVEAEVEDSPAEQEVLDEEDAAVEEEPAVGEPSAEELVEEQPSVEEVLDEQPSAEEVVEEQPSVEEVLEDEPAPDAEPVPETTAEAELEEEES